MSEVPAYPAIEPTTFDVIVVGSGLPESIIAAAASAAGKSVLHIDRNPFYGSHFSSISLPELLSFLLSHSVPAAGSSPADDNDDDKNNISVVGLSDRPLYSDVEAFPIPPELQNSRKFCPDVSGPRVLFCAGHTIDFLMKSGVSQYLEFKSIDRSYIAAAAAHDDGTNGNHLSVVPDSRSAIFNDPTLALIDKTKLWHFFQHILDHLQALAAGRPGLVSQQDLDTPFAHFLDKNRLSPKIKSIILYAIAMANYDQTHVSASKNLLKTSDGINRLALYLSSLRRFPNASGAMLYPMYGQGELPQAFCRRAAVKGCLYVLRMHVVAVLVDRGNARRVGIRLASGQDLFSQQLVLDTVFSVPRPSDLSLPDSPADHGPIDIQGKIARSICITRKPLNSDASNLLAVYPPRSLYPEQAASVRVLQVGSSLAICPKDMFVWYLSALCSNADEGKKLLNAAIAALSTSGSTKRNSCGEDSSFSQSEDVGEAKPNLVWRTIYVQEVTEGSCGSVSSSFSPDGEMDYDGLIDATQKNMKDCWSYWSFQGYQPFFICSPAIKFHLGSMLRISIMTSFHVLPTSTLLSGNILFQKLFPNDEFFQDEPPSEDSLEDHGQDLEL
ncbi:Rab escort protein 1-like protein [Drosera capensis]